MEVSFEERRAMLYRDLERGDALVGRINNVREYGFFLTLLCAAGGLVRDIEDLELSVRWPITMGAVSLCVGSLAGDEPASWLQMHVTAWGLQTNCKKSLRA